jgi:multidrug efflux pump subunit AcrA (membrane-fusion protein)
MTARVEIEVEERAKALFVPLEAVFEREGRSVVYIAGRRPRPREVVLGPSSADFVVIEKGLSRGERVLLRDPEAALPEYSGAPGT